MNVYDFICNELKKYKITLFAPIGIGNCVITRNYLLDQAGISSGTVIMMAVPYLSELLEGEHNISAYCAVRDYHGFFDMLKDSVLPSLKSQFPKNKFAIFADHSPIDERDAAAKCGFGVIGKNGLLITEKYSSYVFLGEIITDAEIGFTEHEIQYCNNCGLCQKACPIDELGQCLSAITQKKQDLSASEKAAILKYNTAWGCDICQRVCPHTVSALKNKTAFTEIEYFLSDVIPDLSSSIIDSLSDDEFNSRAFAWRGRNTVIRNIKILENKKS